MWLTLFICRAALWCVDVDLKMSKEKEEKDSKFGDAMASNISLERANKIRSYIKLYTKGFWVFVYKNRSTGKYNVSCQNTWGGPLIASELAQIKSVVKEFKEAEKEEKE